MSTIRSAHWMAFLRFIVFMKNDTRWSAIVAAFDNGGSVSMSKPALTTWCRIYSSILRRYLVEVAGIIVGKDSGEVLAYDESIRGQLKNKDRKLDRAKAVSRIKSRRPGRTIWHKKPAAAKSQVQNKASVKASSVKKQLLKKPANVWKKPAGRSVKKQVLKKPSQVWRKPAASNRWIWGAVEVGKVGGKKKFHSTGDKRVTLTMLPPPEQAIERKTRGKRH